MHARDEQGRYVIHQPITCEEIITLARSILEDRMQRGETLSSPSASIDYLKMHFADRVAEAFAVIFLDNAHRVIEIEEMFHGTIDGCSVHPREIVRSAIHHNAAAVILAHNHPSGVPEPSTADRALTRRLVDALVLIDVRVLDHIVIGGGKHCSFAERGFL